MTPEKTIYIADDDANIRETIKAFLEKSGYAVCAFDDGEKLLNAFHEKPADLVILDVNMPVTNGFIACKTLRQTSRVPVFLLTARDSDLDHQTGLDLGCDAFFVKPISTMTIVMTVSALFRRIEYEWAACREADARERMLVASS